MADYLSRLAERAIGAASLARPVIAARFAPTPALAADARPGTTIEESRVEAAVEEAPRSTSLPSASDRVPTSRSAAEPPEARDWRTSLRRDPRRDGRSSADEALSRGHSRTRDERMNDAAPWESPRAPVVTVQVAPPVGPRGMSAAPTSDPRPAAASAPQTERRALRAEPSPAPTISVTIGRVDVRAIADSPPPAAPRPRSVPPSLTLDEYLRRRDAGGRR